MNSKLQPVSRSSQRAEGANCRLLTPFEETVGNIVRRKRATARDYQKMAKLFAGIFFGFCIGGIYLVDKVGELTFGMVWVICALLVMALMDASRSVTREADCLEVYLQEGSAECHKKIINALETTEVPPSGGPVRQAILNPTMV